MTLPNPFQYRAVPYFKRIREFIIQIYKDYNLETHTYLGPEC